MKVQNSLYFLLILDGTLTCLHLAMTSLFYDIVCTYKFFQSQRLCITGEGPEATLVKLQSELPS